MERVPQKMTRAEYDLWSYRDYLNTSDYDYKDMLFLSHNLIEDLYPPGTAMYIHAHLYPEEELFDTDPEAFHEKLQNLPVELLTLLDPSMFKKMTDKCMDDAITMAVESIPELHANCFCDQNVDTSDPLTDPLPSCEEDECPVDELREKLLGQIIDPDALQLHAMMNDTGVNTAEHVDYRVRLIYACQRARLLTPAIAGTMVGILYTNAFPERGTFE